MRFEIFDSQEGPNAKCIIQKKKLAKQEAAVVELLVWEASWLVLLHFKILMFFFGKKRSSNCGCTFGVGGKSGVVAANKSWNVIRSIITPTGKQVFFSWKVQILLFKN